MAGLIDDESSIVFHRATIHDLAAHVARRVRDGLHTSVVFAGRQNARRSVLAEVWAVTAARAQGLRGISFHSAGLQPTDVHPNTLAALRRAGFLVEARPGGGALVRVEPDASPIEVFAKDLEHSSVRRRDLTLVSVCKRLDDSPMTKRAEQLFRVHFADPAEYDGMRHAERAYDVASRNIGAFQLAVIENIRGLLELG